MNLEEFRRYAQEFNVIPVYRKLLADGETPLGVYRKLAGTSSASFLLESAEHGGVWSRYSFIGAHSQATLTEVDGLAQWIGVAPAGAPSGIDPLEALRLSASHLRSPKIEGLPPLTGGLVGYMGYDSVRRLEKLPNISKKDIPLPEIAFMLTSDLAVMDHAEGSITLIANAINWDGTSERVDQAWENAIERIEKMHKDLLAPLAGQFDTVGEKSKPDFIRATSSVDFRKNVELIKEEIRSGEAFQVVLSQRFSTPCEASSIDVYRMLRLHNPSPYMYLIRFHDGVDIVGSSPEALIKISDRKAMIHPIAGTRQRGVTAEEDIEIGNELIADPKERAEHLMLVDLGRNDLGRVCKAGSVEVIEFMNVERYSHVMHIVSTVTGELNNEISVVDALAAVFPAGTLSGAPKPRAMEIIEKLEPTRRALYGGCIGYFDFNGNLDTAIAIRTALIRDGIAYVQAGAGIVADSIPESEDNECLNKAAAVLGAIAAAKNLVK